jgi:hypothetical protein
LHTIIAKKRKSVAGCWPEYGTERMVARNGSAAAAKRRTVAAPAIAGAAVKWAKLQS